VILRIGPEHFGHRSEGELLFDPSPSVRRGVEEVKAVDHAGEQEARLLEDAPPGLLVGKWIVFTVLYHRIQLAPEPQAQLGLLGPGGPGPEEKGQ
jgi:hypothetical protein